jgi:methyltransferase (TIGR00027 family)
MARADDDSWDLASGVGASATMVAAARAVTTRTSDPVITDPFAEPLVRAVGIDFFTRLAGGELQPSDVDDETTRAVQRMVDVMAVRTRYFDEFSARAARAGIRQAVILACGLDSRAYRLRWPAGATVFEVDQPEVIEFKTATLAELGAAPTADRRVVAVDLRRDWPAALWHAGFDAARPTVWLAEGLLGYLRPDTRNRLLDTITALTAIGSWLALDAVPPLSPAHQNHFRQRIRMLIQRWQRHGFDVDMADMVYLDEHNDIARYLDTCGWETNATSTSELFLANGLDPIAEHDDDGAPFAIADYISATMNSASRTRPGRGPTRHGG